MSISFAVRAAFAVFALLLTSTLAFGQSERLKQDLSGSFARFDSVRITKDTSARQGEMGLSFVRGGALVEVALEPNDMRAVRYRAQDTGKAGETIIPRGDVTTFKGFVRGEAGSSARFNIPGMQMEGYFTSGGETLFVEPASNYSKAAAADDYVIYRMEDYIGDRTLGCSSRLVDKIEYGKSLAGIDASQVVQGLRRFEIATEADYEFVNDMGGPSQANTEILGIMNAVDGLYRNQLNMSISVVFQHTWTTPDPYAGASSDPILRNFQSYWESNFSQTSTPRDTSHLFSGKQQVLSQGYAFVGIVCAYPGAAYGLSGYVGWAPGKYLITGHELGHNLGANHVDATQSCANTLMNAALSGSTPLSFCTYSQNEINTYVSANGSCLTGATGRACRFDFDGDSKADISVFRPSTGAWYVSRSSSGFTGIQFGQAGDKSVAADYDGDGIADAAVYRAGMWYRLKSATNTFDGISFGTPTDTPAPADFDGDGKTDIAVFRSSTGTWYEMLSSTGGFSAMQFGQAGDVPIPADYDGDGKADINVFRPSTGMWYRISSQTGSFYAVQFGAFGDKAVTADFDGDGRADTAVWRPANGMWYIMRADNSYYGNGFGMAGDVPVPADYDGDGKADIAVYRPSTGMWYRFDSANGAFEANSFGVSTDQPAPAFYVQ